MGKALSVVKETVQEFYRDEGLGMAASLAFYSIFALPSLLIIVIGIVGLIVDPTVIQEQLYRSAQEYTSPEVAKQVRSVYQHAQQRSFSWSWTTVLGVGIMFFAATAAFAHLQTTLNKIWEVRPKPEQSMVGRFFFKRMVSFAMVVAVALILLASLMFTAVLAAFTNAFINLFPVPVSRVLILVVDGLSSFVIIFCLFTIIFKFLPDIKISWKDAWAGALMGTVLFVAGKYLVGLYISQMRVGTAYEAAGSLAVVLVWLYYSSITLCFSGNFAQAYARHSGREIEPSKGVMRVDEPRHVSHRE